MFLSSSIRDENLKKGYKSENKCWISSLNWQSSITFFLQLPEDMPLSKTYYLCIHYLLSDYDAHVLYNAPFEMLSRIKIILA